MAAVQKHGTSNWTVVAQAKGLHPSRNGKACSLRWREYLDPTVQSTRLLPFTPEEQQTVVNVSAACDGK